MASRKLLWVMVMLALGVSGCGGGAATTEKTGNVNTEIKSFKLSDNDSSDTEPPRSQ